MTNWKIKHKLFFVLFLFMIIILINYGLEIHYEITTINESLDSLEEHTRNNYDVIIKSQIESVLSMLQVKYQEVQQGTLTLEAAKTEAAAIIRNIEYGDDGYIWVDTSNGTNVVLYGSEVEGTNRYNFKDAYGKPIFKQTIEIALKGGGYLDYYFPKKGGSEPFAKRAYCAYFKPFDWIIGTGVYTNEIDELIQSKEEALSEDMKNHFFILCSISVVTCLGLFLLTYQIYNNIRKPIELSAAYAKDIADNGLDIKIPRKLLKRKDEIGDFISAVSLMQSSLKKYFYEKEETNKRLIKEKEFLHTLMASIGDGIISLDMNKKITLINSKALHILEESSQNIIGRNYEEFFSIKRDKDNIDFDKILSFINEENQVELIQGMLQVRRNNNSIAIEIGISPVTNGENVIGVVLLLRDITENLKKISTIEYLSYHDQLTDLYNRSYFEAESKRLSCESNYPLSLIVADLNGLKFVNDVYGHLHGDKLIKAFAEVLEEVAGKDNIVSRIGGDEFAILLPKTNLNDAEAMINKAKKLLENKKVDNIPCSAAFGAAVKDNDKYDMSDLFKNADANMYECKFNESQKFKDCILDTILKNMFEYTPKEATYYLKVRETSIAIGKVLALQNGKLLEMAAYLYDIGYITFDCNQICDNMYDMDKVECYDTRHHAVSGYHILKSSGTYEKVSEVVLYHHENYDGTGYPRGLMKTEIPIESRVIAVVDAYYSILESKSNEETVSKQEAINIIAGESNKKFDPNVVKALIIYLNKKEFSDWEGAS